jgi:hypothetical protein
LATSANLLRNPARSEPTRAERITAGQELKRCLPRDNYRNAYSRVALNDAQHTYEGIINQYPV